jgi:OPT oligopeptide transporter protein
MAFKALGTNAVDQAVSLLGDLKLGHYLKISPLDMMIAQIYGTLLGAYINTSSMIWALETFKPMLGNGNWMMSGYQVFYNAGAIW